MTKIVFIRSEESDDSDPSEEQTHPRARPTVSILALPIPDKDKIPAVVFPLFPKLSPETRVNIWRLMLNTPQVIAVKPCWKLHGIAGRTPNRELQCLTRPRNCLSVNNEARHEARSKVLPCHMGFEQEGPTTEAPVERRLVVNPRPTFYANLAVDTIWYVNRMGYDTLKAFTLFFLPMSGARYTHNPTRSIAVSWDHWYNRAPFDINEESQQSVKTKRFLEMMRSISRVDMDEDIPDKYKAERRLAAEHLQELILVVGSEAASEKDGIVFIEPTMSPKHYLPLEVLAKRKFCYPSESSVPEATWDIMNSEAENFIRGYKAKKAAEAQKFLDSNVESEIENDQIELGREFTDPPHWKIPKIRHMQATTVGALEKIRQLKRR